MSFDKDLQVARDVVRRLRYLEYLDNILYYDRFSGGCPPAGLAYGQEVNEYVVRQADDLLLSPECRRAVMSLREAGDEDFASDVDRGVVRWLTRRFDEALAVPVELSAELSSANAEGQRAWAACRAANDFEGFLPVLRRQFDLQRRIACAIDPDARTYDVVLSRCDPSYTCDELDALFAPVKDTVREILAASADAWAHVDKGVLSRGEAGRTAEASDRLVARVQALLGADADRTTPWRLAHPVTVCTGPRDNRPSTFPLGEHTIVDELRTVAHETGHAMYGAGSSEAVVAAGLWGGIEGFMHESQSRFYENHVYRSAEFWQAFMPEFARELPAFAGVGAEEIAAALNKPEPGVSRLAADELTYPLHIIIRHEIERDVFDGKLALEDVREAWDAKYEEYLGVRPANAGEGVLCDVHWASGCVGYFFSYALGDMYAAQFEHALLADEPRAFARLAEGDGSLICGWLAEHVWAHGQTYTAPQTLRVACGEDLDAGYYTDYLRRRFLR